MKLRRKGQPKGYLKYSRSYEGLGIRNQEISGWVSKAESELD